METVLTLGVGGLPPFSARGCTQILKPIQLGKMARTISGELLHLGSKVLKYKSTIEAKDKSVLAVNDFSPGTHVRVGCIQRLWEKVSGTEHVMSREAVLGSVSVVDNQQNIISFSQCAVQITIDSYKNLMENEEYFVTYRPYLDMRVTDFTLKTKEWLLESEWILHLEEI